ncbi:10109_t:CDS:2 [Paraglomus occultum]|uniref:10109_t:CDS:1 n=1 Tax=Paraglomus occultum TaxID=144539 RepID=A0A9N9GIE8_9GLOM|nr:10109_t:CDS:2 [Paraglomus occultum]
MLCLCTPEQAIDVGGKVMLVQRNLSDRINRKHARLKYTIDDHSLKWFHEEVENRLGYKLQPPREFIFDSNADGPRKPMITGVYRERTSKPQIEGLLKEYKLDSLQYTGIRLIRCLAWLYQHVVLLWPKLRYLPTLVEKIDR